MRNGIKALTLPAYGAALLFTLSLTAQADPLPATPAIDLAHQTLDLSDDGGIMVNGKAFVPEAAPKPADLYAEVVKVIQGPDASTILYLRPVEARKMHDDGTVDKIPVSGEPRPFVAENAWKMFDAEGEITTDPRFALRVILPYPTDGDKSIDAIWNECQGPISGNYTGLPCNKTRGLAPEYLVYLKKNYIPCINQSLKAAKLPPAKSVHLMHDGTLADDQHSSGSLHTVGRAIDVQVVTTKDASGKTNSFDFRTTNTDHVLSQTCSPAGTKTCQFFEAFRACWGKLQVDRKCPPRQDGPIGTMGWEDARHIAHHLHTSYPFCPNNNGYFITEKNHSSGK